MVCKDCGEHECARTAGVNVGGCANIEGTEMHTGVHAPKYAHSARTEGTRRCMAKKGGGMDKCTQRLGGGMHTGVQGLG